MCYGVIMTRLLLHAPLVGGVLAQVLVEDGGREDGVGVVILQLQVAQVCVGLPVRTDDHLTERQPLQKALVWVWNVTHVVLF